MKSILASVVLMSSVFTLSAAVTVTSADRETMKGFIEKNKTELQAAFPKTPPRVLVFSRTETFVHEEALVYVAAMFRIAGQAGLVRPDFTTNYTALTAANLAQYQMLVLNNTTTLKIKEGDALQQSIADFVKNGGGYVLLHAGLDTFGEAPTLCDIAQGLFDGHPWYQNGTWSFKVDDPKSPLTKMFGPGPFKFSDEIYQHKRIYGDRSKKHVLLSLDMSDPVTAKSSKEEMQNNKEGNDYPVSWTREYGKGRVFATSFGHDKRAYLDPRTFLHILLGVASTLPEQK